MALPAAIDPSARLATLPRDARIDGYRPFGLHETLDCRTNSRSCWTAVDAAGRAGHD